MSPSKKPTFEEWLAVSELAFEWAESYDDKDWDRLHSILAPTVSVNYGGVNNAIHSALPAADFITMMRNPLFLGDPNIASQHLLALSKWEKVSDGEIHSWHQSRAAHVRYVDKDMGQEKEGEKGGGTGDKGQGRTVAAKGHGHGLVKTVYRKVGEEWRWAGIETRVRFNEYEFEKVFLGAAGKFGDEEGKKEEVKGEVNGAVKDVRVEAAVVA